MSSLVMNEQPGWPPSTKAAANEPDLLARPASHGGIDALYAEGRLTPAALQSAHDMLLGPRDWLLWIDRALLALGVTLVVSGIVFFFAYNWTSLPGWGKLAIAQALVWGFAVAAWNYHIEHLLGQTLLTAAAMMVGVLIAVFGQVYQTGADAWTGFALWAALILPWVLVGRFQPLWLLWLVITNVAMITFWFQIVFPVSRSRVDLLIDWTQPAFLVAALAVINGSVLVAGEWAAEQGWEFARPRWPRTIVWLWVMIVLTGAMLAYTVHLFGRDTYAPSPFTLGGMINVTLYTAAAIGGYSYARYRTRDIAGLAILLLSGLSIVLTAVFCIFFTHNPGGPGIEVLFLFYGLIVCGGFGASAWWLRRLALEMAEEVAPLTSGAALLVEPITPAPESQGTEAPLKMKVVSQEGRSEASPLVSWYRLLALWNPQGDPDKLLAAAVAEQSRLEAEGNVEPWYYHLLVGIGAWLAACFAFPWIALFLMPFGQQGAPYAAMVYGVIFIACGIFLRRIASGTFAQQFSLVTSIVGHCLLLGGLAIVIAPRGMSDGMEPFFVVAIGVVSITFYLFDDYVHRVIASAAGLLFFTGLVTSPFMHSYPWSWQIEGILTSMLIIELGIFATLSLVRWFPPLARPVFYSLVLHIGFLIIVVTAIHEPRDAWSDWPVVWGLAIGLGITAVGLMIQTLRVWREPAALAIVACIALAIAGTPELLGFSAEHSWWFIFTGSSIAGLLLAAWLLVVGHAQGDAFLTLLGLMILPAAIIFYYYSIEFSLLAKACILLASGGVLLAARRLALWRAPDWETAA